MYCESLVLASAGIYYENRHPASNGGNGLFGLVNRYAGFLVHREKWK